ncbi:MAG: hypothetical protein ACLSA0_24155 [Eisenbergiella massiliensis]
MEYNSSDIITSSLWSVGKTLIAGVLISMAVLFIFFGDFKASLIVGSSMPISPAGHADSYEHDGLLHEYRYHGLPCNRHRYDRG